ncbi:OLC1v1018099C1 [Oldenlandia corymbosa var. corymbosa]|uniref:OLC1v1018099C1 n=1 Tax=Oldenlandia corymbosa var. corymbosa TaxID=529605 RepID=A0AAV1EAV7_OLDCO|nr:OLC1v1018099C1 [Oldenlandia corymbosa var. corymbosa]
MKTPTCSCCMVCSLVVAPRQQHPLSRRHLSSRSTFPIVDLYLAPPQAAAAPQQQQQPGVVFPYLDINVAPPGAEEEMMMDIDNVVVAPPEEVKAEKVSEEPAVGGMNSGTVSFDWADLNALPAVDDSSLWGQAMAGTSFQRMNDPGVFDDEENYPW